MSLTVARSNPEKEQVHLTLKDRDVTLRAFQSYSFDSDFLDPTDAWEFSLPNEGLNPREREALGIASQGGGVGASVALTINGRVQATGHVDAIGVDASPGSGAVWSIRGRDRLAQAVDAHADPAVQFREGDDLLTVLRHVFGPFGWGNEDSFELSNEGNRGIRSGFVPRTGKRGRLLRRDMFKLSHQFKPYQSEGAHAFASRLCQRLGLWIRPSADGQTLVVASADFAQDPSFSFRRSLDGRGTNILGGRVHFDMTDQPSVIVADGAGGGCEGPISRLRTVCVHPYLGVDATGATLPAVRTILARYPDATLVPFPVQPHPPYVTRLPPRAIFLHDPESKSPAQLEAFVRRQMSLLVRKTLTCDYVLEGHGQIVGGQFRPFDVDTVAEVDDELAGVRERMYVLRRTFEKSRGEGTATRLHLVRLNSIHFQREDGPVPPRRRAA